jgi:hypothetical protein
MNLSFKMAAYSLESGEYLVCEYSIDGGAWTQAAKLVNGNDNSTYHSYSVSIPQGNIVQIRFRMVGNSTYDYGYIDDIVLTGDRK